MEYHQPHQPSGGRYLYEVALDDGVAECGLVQVNPGAGRRPGAAVVHTDSSETREVLEPRLVVEGAKRVLKHRLKTGVKGATGKAYYRTFMRLTIYYK